MQPRRDMQRKPLQRLLPGQIIGVIAPASGAPTEDLARAPAVLESIGYRVKMFPGCLEQTGFLAGSDECRLADLHNAFADPDIAAILCLRGGYGSGRLLDRIDEALLLSNPKPLIGYSDITALHAMLSNAGMPSFHGPMLTSDLLDVADPAEVLGVKYLQAGLRAGDILNPTLAPSVAHVSGTASGRLVGGNLSLIASLVGTPWALEMNSAILFLEEIGESPYRVDRLLLQLRLSGALAQLRGVLLGSFTGGEWPAEVLADYLMRLNIPVLSGWPAGHGSPNTLLPLGALVELDATCGTVTLAEDVLV